MNSWQQRERADFYMDRSRNARFSFYQYAVAFREVQMWFFDKYKRDERAIHDNLYTLIKTINPTITLISQSQPNDLTINHINYPADYHYFSKLSNYVDGSLIETKDYASYNQIDNILLDAFRKPSNERCYLLEDGTGWRIYRGYGGVYTNELTYLISPSDWSIGTESDVINSGATALTLGVNYTATAPSVSAGIKYDPGVQFSATSAVLTSGQVIPSSVLVNSNLPDTVHEEISRRVASFMQGSVKDAFGANFSAQIAESDGK